jgi:predicted TIM-barrel fold metal-dependent hydrolase
MKTPVIDFHAHVGKWGTMSKDDDPAKYLRVMDAAGVDRTCINNPFHGDARRGNDLVAGYVARYPDRFIGVGYVTPRYPQEALLELARCFDELGMRFLKIYPDYLGRPVDDPAYLPIFEWANSRGIVIMSHSFFHEGSDNTLTAPNRFVPLADRFPRVRWVLGHAGNARAGQVQSVEAAKACPNIFLESCTSMGEHGTIEFLVEGAGDDRVLYGSDMPLMDARFQVGRIVTADISNESKRKVLGLNAIKLLGLESDS